MASEYELKWVPISKPRRKLKMIRRKELGHGVTAELFTDRRCAVYHRASKSGYQDKWVTLSVNPPGPHLGALAVELFGQKAVR